MRAIIRLLSKLHSLVKIGLFGTFIAKFFDHMYTYALKIWQSNCSKTLNFFKQSEFRKKSIFFLSLALISAAPTGSLINPPDAPTIIIDVGHGGTDRGARAHNPYCEEKKLCLLTARLVRQYLDQLGYHVVMTRNTDNFIPLPKRVEIASQAQANIFVSIHFNSSKSTGARGIEVFFHNSNKNKIRSTASKKLADSILTKVIRRTSAKSRGVKKGNFYVIRETSMPAVLVEGGFISNSNERNLLKSRDYQEKLARGVADGIDQYFKARWKKAKKK
jgi:N-acetylmuramoyl-L-alanine amidase